MKLAANAARSTGGLFSVSCSNVGLRLDSRGGDEVMVEIRIETDQRRGHRYFLAWSQRLCIPRSIVKSLRGCGRKAALGKIEARLARRSLSRADLIGGAVPDAGQPDLGEGISRQETLRGLKVIVVDLEVSRLNVNREKHAVLLRTKLGLNPAVDQVLPAAGELFMGIKWTHGMHTASK